MTILHLHLIDYEDTSRRAIARECEEAGWKTTAYTSIEEFTTRAGKKDCALLVVSIPESWKDDDSGSKLEKLASWHNSHPQTQLILLVPDRLPSIDRITLDLHARHTLTRPYHYEDLAEVLALAGQGIGKRARMNAINKRLKKHIGFEEIIGVSKPIRDVIELAKKVAESDCTSVMITGECGTGKGAFARAIHQSSPRSSGPFLEVNCAAIPRNLLESEFFGHEKGAFTDAKERKIGLFECANGGTIFLDEVGEIDYSLQAKLLKFLDSRVIRRISGTQFLPVDVRIISATNRDLKSDIEQKLFRADLFYRLNVVEISIPPLRERKEDIRPIAAAYAKRFSSRLNKGKIGLTGEAIGVLEQYPWPGNIRELINIIERAVLLDTKGTIGPQDLPLAGEERDTTVNITEKHGIIRIDMPPDGASLNGVEKALILAALECSGGNMARAARLLEVGRGTLRYKLKKHGIDPTAIKENIKNGRFEPVSIMD